MCEEPKASQPILGREGKARQLWWSTHYVGESVVKPGNGGSVMKKKMNVQCAECQTLTSERICMTPGGKASKGCPTVGKKTLVQKANKEYKKKPVAKFARKASIQEGECYSEREKRPYVMHPVKPRILEIMEFARKMKYGKLGLVFCIGLAKEAMIVSQLFTNQGFEVTSVACKAGGVPKEEIGVKEEEKIFIGGHESMCNPILQAMVVNEEKTDFNVLLGLCVGHDSLFFKYADAPTTVLAVKDRVTGHNPLAALYISGNYYSWLNQNIGADGGRTHDL
jgi:uncharacterized metal-binding protein